MIRSLFHEGLVVADVVYNPKETRLLREAKEHGCTVLCLEAECCYGRG